MAAGFLSSYLNGHLPYVRRHITVNKIIMLSASLNKAFPSFLHHKVEAISRSSQTSASDVIKIAICAILSV